MSHALIQVNNTTTKGPAMQSGRSEIDTGGGARLSLRWRPLSVAVAAPVTILALQRLGLHGSESFDKFGSRVALT